MSQSNDQRRDRESLQHQAEHTRPRRRSALFGYLVILFAVAFGLLLMAYFQQQRQNAETSDALKQSVSAVDALQKLMENNEELTGENEALKAQVEELEQQLWDANAFSAETQNDLREKIRSLNAMDYFWQIDEAYVRGRYTLCRELIQSLEDSGLASSLPKEKAFDNDRFSPADRYKEIYDALF